MQKVNQVYFSATGTTEACVNAICEGIGWENAAAPINLADDVSAPMPSFTADDVVVVASPVYGGRLPGVVSAALEKIKGNGAAAIAVVVYGNRDYDDALLELTDILRASGLRIFGAGAFIGQHSIFSQVGADRPDEQDKQELRKFGEACRVAIEGGTERKLQIKGNRPYKKIAAVPIHPKGDEAHCTKCGLCVAYCPAGAIDAATPWATHTAKCLTCGRCIQICPQKTRRNSGLLFNMIGAAFKAGFSKRKDPFWTVGD